MVICLERRADLHMAQLMPLPLTDSCLSKIQIGFTFLVPAHPGSPGKGAIKRVCVRVCVCVCVCVSFPIRLRDDRAVARPGLCSQTVVDPAGARPVVDVGRRPELERDADAASAGRVLLLRHRPRHRAAAAAAAASLGDHGGDVAPQRAGQRQGGDAGRAWVDQVACDDGSTAVLQAAETAHACHQRHLRLRRCTRRD